MRKSANFSDILEAAEKLPIDAIEEMSEILHKRAIELRRKELARDIKSARTDLKSGRAKKVSVDSLMKAYA